MATSFARYRIPDQLWFRILPLIPELPKKRPKGGRPYLKNIKSIADGIFYKLRTGCQWNAVPRCFGASSTIHLYFQRWVELGIFEEMWELALAEYDDLVGIAWKHQSIDTSTVKAPLGGEKNGSKSDGQRQTWKQTLRTGRRTWRAAVLHDRTSEQARFTDTSTHVKNA